MKRVDEMSMEWFQTNKTLIYRYDSMTSITSVYNLWRRHNIILSAIQQLHVQHSVSHNCWQSLGRSGTFCTNCTKSLKWQRSRCKAFCKGHKFWNNNIGMSQKLGLLNHKSCPKCGVFGPWFWPIYSFANLQGYDICGHDLSASEKYSRGLGRKTPSWRKTYLEEMG